MQKYHLILQNGIGGCLFLAVNASMITALFSVILLEFRTKASGAKTYAQFIRQRFGPVAHVMAIFIAILTSLYGLLKDITRKFNSRCTI